MIMVDSKLKQLRLELSPSITQEDLAVKAGLRINTYRNAERGKNCSYTTAQAILKTLNGYRVASGLPELERVEDLGLHIV